MVYQDPLASLNPCLTVGEQLSEVLTVHRGAGGRGLADRLSRDARAGPHARPARDHAPLPAPALGRPAAARGHRHGLLANPDLLIMDEPTTGLDVTVEAAVLDLVAELRRDFDTAILFISHNLGVIARDLRPGGRHVRRRAGGGGRRRRVFWRPRHPYTRSLLRCLPRADASRAASSLPPIPGHVPSPAARPPGCVFEPRCGFAARDVALRRRAAEAVAPGHVVRCVRWQEHRPAEPAAASARRPQTARRRPAPLLSLDNVRAYYHPAAKLLTRLLGRRRRAGGGRRQLRSGRPARRWAWSAKAAAARARSRAASPGWSRPPAAG